MSLIIYSTTEDGLEEEIVSRCEPIVGEENMATYHRLTELQSALRKPFEKRVVCVALLGRQEDLAGLFTLNRFLNKLKLVLVLPDNASETMSWAHKLRPRFISVLGTDMGQLSAVVEKMARADGP
jgi:hypothetical protein